MKVKFKDIIYDQNGDSWLVAGMVEKENSFHNSYILKNTYGDLKEVRCGVVESFYTHSRQEKQPFKLNKSKLAAFLTVLTMAVLCKYLTNNAFLSGFISFTLGYGLMSLAMAMYYHGARSIWGLK